MKARAQDMDRLLEEVQNDEEEMKGKEFMRIPGITYMIISPAPFPTAVHSLWV